MSCGVGHRQGRAWGGWGAGPLILPLLWLWLWRRPVTTAPTQPLAWELPYAVGMALKKANICYRKLEILSEHTNFFHQSVKSGLLFYNIRTLILLITN